MENINTNTGNKTKETKIEERIIALEGNEEATLADVTSEKGFNKLITKIKKEEEVGIENKKQVIELFEKKLRDMYYSFISLTVAVEDINDIPQIKKELEEKGIKVTNEELKGIKNTILNTITLKKEQLDSLKKQLANKEENEEDFDSFVKKNNSLDNTMLYEICTRKITKGASFSEENEIKNKILNVLEDVDDFNNHKNIWNVLKQEIKKGNYKNHLRIIELEGEMEETFNRKVQKFLSDEYRDIFIKRDNLAN